MKNPPDEHDYWNAVFREEDPWDYTSDYEQLKYSHTLELMPEASISQALELGCAEGLFTRMLSDQVGSLLAVDISDRALNRARQRCIDADNVQFRQHDIADGVPGENLDLVVCSEILYYLRDLEALRLFARRVKDSLSVGGYLLMTHANMVSDDKYETGFDFNEIGAKLIGQTFSSDADLEFLRELRTPLYRVQLFRRSGLSSGRTRTIPELPREVLQRDVSVEHPCAKIGGCVVTSAEARFCWVTSQVPILMYHRIADDGPNELAPYRVMPADFERQLAYLQRHGYHSIGLEDYCAARYEMDARKIPGRAIVLTFDDAYLDFYENAWPLLKKYGFGATVFVPTGFVGGCAVWDREYGEPASLMGWEQIRELHENGVKFGSHGCNHEPITGMPGERALEDAIESKELLEKMLGTQISGYCYPFCEADGSSEYIVTKAGYTHAVHGLRGTQPNPDSRFYLPRIEIFGNDTIDMFIGKLPTPEPAEVSEILKYERLHAIRDRATYLMR